MLFPISANAAGIEDAFKTFMAPLMSLLEHFEIVSPEEKKISPKEFARVILKESETDPDVAWKQLKDGARNDLSIAFIAHELGHAVGEQMFAKNGIAGISGCDNSFIFACYHGFMTAFSRDGRYDSSKLYHACVEDAERKAQERGADANFAVLAGCVHGMGHGFLERNRHNLRNALRECETLPSDAIAGRIIRDDTGNVYLGPVQSCKEGVFMEYFVGGYAIEVPHNDPWSFCQNLGESNALACARYIHFLKYPWKLSLQETVALCLNAPNAYMRNNCFFEIDFFEEDVADSKLPPAETIVAVCSDIKDPETSYRCLRAGAVTFTLERYPGAHKIATQICAAAGTQYVRSCTMWATGVAYAYGDAPPPVSLPRTPKYEPNENQIAWAPSSETLQRMRMLFANLLGPSAKEFATLFAPVELAPTPETFAKLSYTEQALIVEEMSKNDPRAAWRYLTRAGLKDAFEGHRLGHLVGNYLYWREGITALSTCTPDFTYACHHSIIDAFLAAHGDAENEELQRVCTHPPTTLDAEDSYYFRQSCSHGAGHGFASFYSPSMERIVRACDTAFTGDMRRSCYDGIFMALSITPSTRALVREHPWQLCANMNGDLLRSCSRYMPLMVPSFDPDGSLSGSDDTVHAYLQICAAAPSIFLEDECMQTTAIYIASITGGGTEASRTFCARAKNTRAQNTCLTYVAAEMSFQRLTSHERISTFCNSVSSSEGKDTCATLARQAADVGKGLSRPGALGIFTERPYEEK